MSKTFRIFSALSSGLMTIQKKTYHSFDYIYTLNGSYFVLNGLFEMFDEISAIIDHMAFDPEEVLPANQCN